jgi:hypothetical protein
MTSCTYKVWGALDICNLGGGNSLDLTESLVLVDSMFGENITVELVGLFHSPVEWTGSGEKGIDRLKGAIAGLGIDCKEESVLARVNNRGL